MNRSHRFDIFCRPRILGSQIAHSGDSSFAEPFQEGGEQPSGVCPLSRPCVHSCSIALQANGSMPSSIGAQQLGISDSVAPSIPHLSTLWEHSPQPGSREPPPMQLGRLVELIRQRNSASYNLQQLPSSSSPTTDAPQVQLQVPISCAHFYRTGISNVGAAAMHWNPLYVTIGTRGAVQMRACMHLL
jgi:hypothetical protein